MKNFSPKIIKQDFPIFQTYPELVYLDSAATSQKPQVVIDAVTDFYKTKNANIHRGIYRLADEATTVYENARKTVASFINAKSGKEIIFTGNTNQAINLVAYGWARKFLKAGNVVALSEMEHHANIVPWLRLREERGIELVFLPITEDYRLDYQLILSVKNVKLVALTHTSNVLGTINPLEDIIPLIKKQHPKTKILIDAAQSVPHFPIDVQKLNCDFLAFSSHKMLGSAGVGVLWAKEELLEDMDPLFVGSHMIKTVTKEKATWADLPDKFEPGTGNLEGVVGLDAAIRYLRDVGFEHIIAHEQELTEYTLEKLQTVDNLILYGSKTAKNRLGIFSFGIHGVHPHDIAQILDSQNIAIRSGHHCAQVLMKALGVNATARASFYLYNSKEDVERLVEGIGMVKKTLQI